METTAVAAPRNRIQLAYDSLATPVGDVLIVCSETALCSVDFHGYDDRMHLLLRKRFGEYELVEANDPLGMTSMLRAYFNGDMHAIDDVVVDTGGTPYQERVWAALRDIPHGQTWSYGQLATHVGGGTIARAVGHANSLNPVAIVVPCHRVIGANTSLTGYGGGLERKQWLLEHERTYAGPPSLFTTR